MLVTAEGKRMLLPADGCLSIHPSGFKLLLIPVDTWDPEFVAEAAEPRSWRVATIKTAVGANSTYGCSRTLLAASDHRTRLASVGSQARAVVQEELFGHLGGGQYRWGDVRGDGAGRACLQFPRRR